MEKSKRVIWVDIAKGITILLVVFGHAVQGIVSSKGLDISGPNWSLFLGKQLIYGFHMPTFFVISGFFTGYMHRKFIGSLSKKAVRLLKPYFIWSFITASIMQAFSSYTNFGMGIRDFLMSPLIPFSEYWYLYILFFISVFYLIIYRVFGYRTVWAGLFVGIVLFLAEPLLPNVWIVKVFSRFLVYYAIGGIIFKRLNLVDKIFRKKESVIFFTSLIVFSIANIILYKLLMYNNHIVLYYYSFVTASFGAIFIFALSMKVGQLNNLLTNFFQWLGKNSMQVYVMHLIPLAGARIILMKLGIISNYWMLSVTITIISLAICCVAIIIIVKIGINKLLF